MERERAGAVVAVVIQHLVQDVWDSGKQRADEQAGTDDPDQPESDEEQHEKDENRHGVLLLMLSLPTVSIGPAGSRCRRASGSARTTPRCTPLAAISAGGAGASIGFAVYDYRLPRVLLHAEYRAWRITNDCIGGAWQAPGHTVTTTSSDDEEIGLYSPCCAGYRVGD
jgi:hypothetical protein